jgi:cation:H+ antiporter
LASSLSYGLVGMLALAGYSLKRREHKYLQVGTTLAIPFIFVIILLPLTLVPSLIANYNVRVLFGFVFIASYFGYMALMYRRRGLEQIENAMAPFICRLIPFKRVGCFVQLIVSVVILYFGVRELVSVVNEIAVGFGLSLMGLAIIVIPAATAVPETTSALIWVFRGKDTLSLASLVGEKVLYTTLFPGFGLLLTTGVLDIHAYLSVLGTTTISLLMLLFISRKKVPWYGLTIGFIFFVAYAIATLGLRI